MYASGFVRLIFIHEKNYNNSEAMQVANLLLSLSLLFLLVYYYLFLAYRAMGK